VSIALVALTSAEAYDRREGRAVGLSPRVSVRQVAHATPAYRPDSALPDQSGCCSPHAFSSRLQGGRMLRAMTFLAGLVMCGVAFGATGSASASDATPPLAATDDGYVAPVCGDPVVETLSAFDCTGAEPVPS